MRRGPVREDGVTQAPFVTKYMDAIIQLVEAPAAAREL